MAGMLPGVEAARRRRFHHTHLSCASHSQISPPIGTCFTRRSTFCLYAISSYVFHSNSYSYSSMRKPLSKHQQQGLTDDENNGLCAAAREAKKRLDERLQPQRRSESKRNRVEWRSGFKNNNNEEQRERSSSRISFSKGPESGQLPKEELPKSRKKNWLKLMSWKSWEQEQEDCAVCLDQLRARAHALMQLPCGHRFHSNCLVPWLQANLNNSPHCPCCRTEIPAPYLI